MSSEKHADHETAPEQGGGVPHDTKNHARQSHKKWLITGLAVTSLVVLAFIGIVAIGGFLRATSISYYLPKETIGFIEINTDFGGNQWTNVATLTKSSEPAMLQKMIEDLNSFFQIHLTEDVTPWLARRAGLALLPQGKTAIFLEIKDEKSALDFFEKRRLQGVTERLEKSIYQGSPIYQYIASTPLTLVRIGNYLVITPDEETGKKIIDSTRDPEKNLHGKKMFQKIEENSSHENLVFTFGHPSLLIEEKQTMSDSSSLESILLKLAGVFSGESIEIRSDKKTLIIEHVGRFNDALISKKNDTLNRSNNIRKISGKKYEGNFVRLFPADTKVFMGGTRIYEIMQTFSALTSSASELLSDQIFGNIASKFDKREQDILFSGEYAMGYIDSESSESNVGDGHDMVIALECTDEALLKKLAREIGSQPEFSDTKISFEILGNFAVLATQQKLLEDAKKRWNEKGESLRTAKNVEKIITSQIRYGDDIIIATSEGAAPWLPAFPAEWNVSKTFSHISLASHMSEDGIKTRILLGAASNTTTR